jgi:16S rRNA (uracil1498-N3)-methyltransferase
MTAIEGPVEFDKWLESYKGDLILCDIDGDRQLNLSGTDNASASDSSGANESSNENATPITLLVGPEGGFSDKEVALCVEKGCEMVSLGRRILRAETAAIYGAALLGALSEEE